jgi:hypothetical protein
MHKERGRAGLRNRSHEMVHECVVLDRVDADAVLDGYGQRDRVTHCCNAIRDKRRLRH